MLQRIQSIFILLYTACVFVFLFNETIHIAVAERSYTLNAWGLTPVADGHCDCETQFLPYIMVGILQVAAILFTSIAFFSYKNRKKQIYLIKIAEYLFIIECLFIVYAIVSTGCLSAEIYSISPKIGGIFIATSIVWLLLARFCIKKDERLVQASDRLL